MVDSEFVRVLQGKLLFSGGELARQAGGESDGTERGVDGWEGERGGLIVEWCVRNRLSIF